MKRIILILLAAMLCMTGCAEQQEATSYHQIDQEMDWTGEDVTSEEETAGRAAVLSFSSFDGGGREYSVEVEDASVISVTSSRDYGERDELEVGSPYDQIFTFTGLRPGTTAVAVYGISPILENDNALYTAVVDDMLNVTLESERRLSTLFLYRSGEIRYDSYKIALSREGYFVSVDDGEEQPLDAATAEALTQIIDEYDLAAWDGFDESNDFVLDGESFWLEVQMTDGTSILARGDNAFPDNYYPVMSLMQETLDDAVTAAGDE